MRINSTVRLGSSSFYMKSKITSVRVRLVITLNLGRWMLCVISSVVVCCTLLFLCLHQPHWPVEALFRGFFLTPTTQCCSFTPLWHLYTSVWPYLQSQCCHPLWIVAVACPTHHLRHKHLLPSLPAAAYQALTHVRCNTLYRPIADRQSGGLL